MTSPLTKLSSAARVVAQSTALACALSFGVVGLSQAAPHNHVSNKQNFGTDVIYQIVTDRFLDGNRANNPTGGAFSANCTQLKLYCGGDWQGITNKINDGYFTGMGVTALWISPPVENITALLNYSGSISTSYHGYWARDFFRPNPAFGTMADFTAMVNAAHAKGLKVIIDFAPNHTSPASSTDTSFGENGRLLRNGTPVSTYGNDPNKMFHRNGGTNFSTLEDGTYRNLFDLADLNHQNSTVDQYFRDAIKMWLDTGIDGLRIDAVKHMPYGWQKSWMSYIHGYKPVFTFGEWFLGANEVDPANHYFANTSGMSLLDFEYGQKIRQVFKDGTADMNSLHATIASTSTNYAQVSDQVTFIDNHDMDRFLVAGGSARRMEQAVAVTLMSRGVPAIYYGTEQYMTGVGDPNNRARMTSFNTNTTAYKLIKALAPLRKSNPALAYGTTQQRWVSPDVYIFERKFGSNVVVTAVNRNLSTATSIGGLVTSLPAGSYTDRLGALLGGNNITVGTNGAVPTFTLGAGAVAVWQFAAASSTVANVGHVGPMLGKAGNTLTIDGTGFGTTKGTVHFGTTAVTGANIVSWEDTQIKVKVPAVTPGWYGVSVKRAGSTAASNTYSGFQVLSGNQVTVRFVVNATTNLGEGLYLTGDKFELTNWSSTAPLGIMFNQVVYQYPNWYTDVSVPAGSTLQFKFLKKTATTTVWQDGPNRTFTAPASGTATVQVNW
jgi:glycosidase